jgi:transcriptional regulator with XRE-family HTH domain
MGQSSISQHVTNGGRLSQTLDPQLRRALGRQLRRLRTDRTLTQGELGAPLTRAYVSAVEAGRTVPSLPALQLMVERLDMPMSAFFEQVERDRSNAS